jgi:hypothetical protein
MEVRAREQEQVYVQGMKALTGVCHRVGPAIKTMQQPASCTQTGSLF